MDFLANGAWSSGGGAALAFQAFVLPFLAVRAATGFRLGLIEGSKSTTWLGAAGVAAYALRPTRKWPVGAWIHVDVLGEYQWIGGALPNAPYNVLPRSAVDAVADASFLFVKDVEVVAGAGVEWALAYEGDPARRYSLPRWQGVGEAGIRVQF